MFESKSVLTFTIICRPFFKLSYKNSEIRWWCLCGVGWRGYVYLCLCSNIKRNINANPKLLCCKLRYVCKIRLFYSSRKRLQWSLTMVHIYFLISNLVSLKSNRFYSIMVVEGVCVCVCVAGGKGVGRWEGRA